MFGRATPLDTSEYRPDSKYRGKRYYRCHEGMATGVGWLSARKICTQFDVKGKNHVIMSITDCRDLLYFQHTNKNDRIKWVCGHQGIEHLHNDAISSVFGSKRTGQTAIRAPGSGMPSKGGIAVSGSTR